MTRASRLDVTVGIGYLALAFFLTAGLWAHPSLRAVEFNTGDQIQDEWFLAYGSRLWIGDFSLITDRLNSPDGVNLLNNVSHALPAVLLAPVTLLFGAPVSFALLITGNLAATATAWYLFYAHALGLHRIAAAVAGLCCGFAPGMLSQSNSHINLTGQWLVPVISYCVLRLVQGRTPVWSGLALGLLITAQFFIGQEVLLLTAITLALFTICYAMFDFNGVRLAARPLMTGLGAALGLSVVLLAYPLWVQFAGRQHVPAGPLFPPEAFSADLVSYIQFSPLSVLGRSFGTELGGANWTELNTFFGYVLPVALAGCVVYRWRDPFVRTATVVGVVLAWISLGPTVTIHGWQTNIPALYRVVAGLPAVSSALPTRFALALSPLIALILALALHTALRAPGTTATPLLALTVIGSAILTLAPLPLRTTARAPVPKFFSSGHWRDCVRTGGVLAPVPIVTPADPGSMRWATAARVAFGIPEGYFIGPYGGGGKVSVGISSTPTSALLMKIQQTGRAVPIGAAEREQAREDVDHWRASCVVLGPAPHEGLLKTSLDQLYGPGERVSDIWVWRVREP